MKHFFLPALVLLISSCTPPSMNVQRSALRAAGDLAATGGLEFVKLDDVDRVQAEVKLVSKGILNWLKTGQVPNLTQSEINTKLKTLVPDEFAGYFDTVFTALSALNLNVGQKLGDKNLRRIVAAVTGIMTGAESYHKSDRNPPE